MDDQVTLIEMTTDIIAEYVGHNTVRATELPDLILTVYAALGDIKSPKPVEAATPELKPAVSVKKSVTDEYLICLDDGKRFKSLRRHLTILGMTPDEYREKWGLPRDYPMVAPGYAAVRSSLAKATGLGNARRNVSPVVAEPEVVAEPPVPDEEPVKRRGRQKKAA